MIYMTRKRYAACKIDRSIAPHTRAVFPRRPFLMEIGAACRVPLITYFIAAFQDSKQIYIVMEHCSGGDLLEQLLKEGRAMTEQRVALEVALPVLTSLSHIHNLRIIHRHVQYCCGAPSTQALLWLVALSLPHLASCKSHAVLHAVALHAGHCLRKVDVFTASEGHGLNMLHSKLLYSSCHICLPMHCCMDLPTLLSILCMHRFARGCIRLLLTVTCSHYSL